nr:MAG TPA: hypothetical protein [Caudoviricetes sp.]
MSQPTKARHGATTNHPTQSSGYSYYTRCSQENQGGNDNAGT